jgi:hypothetical protein
MTDPTDPTNPTDRADAGPHRLDGRRTMDTSTTTRGWDP